MSSEPFVNPSRDHDFRYGVTRAELTRIASDAWYAGQAGHTCSAGVAREDCHAIVQDLIDILERRRADGRALLGLLGETRPV